MVEPNRVRSGWVLRVLSITSEILLTAGVGVLIFFLWYAVVNPAVIGTGQANAAGEQSRLFSSQIANPTPAASDATTPTPSPTASVAAPAAPNPVAAPSDTVPVMAEPSTIALPIAVMYVPRFGSDWKRIVRQSTDTARVLNSVDAGVGHYVGTAMPGSLGNFAVAAHDTGYGNTFLALSNLKLGDKIYVQTGMGWYTYQFRNFQFVQPDAVEVLNAIPAGALTPTTDRFITMTTCDPPYHAQERTIAYGTFVGFSTTPPAELAPALAAGN